MYHLARFPSTVGQQDLAAAQRQQDTYYKPLAVVLAVAGALLTLSAIVYGIMLYRKRVC